MIKYLACRQYQLSGDHNMLSCYKHELFNTCIHYLDTM